MRIARIEAFQVQWRPEDPPSARSGFLRVWSDDGRCGLGEVSPMQGGLVSLAILKHHIAPGAHRRRPARSRGDPRPAAAPPGQARTGGRADQRARRARHRAVGPEGPTARAADLAAARRRVAHRAALLLLDRRQRRDAQPGRGAAHRRGAPDATSRRRSRSASTTTASDLDSEIPDHLAKARAVRKLVGDDFPLAFDANNGYTPGGAMRVGRVLEELGYWWFEEPVQHYHVRAMGEVARKLVDHRFRRRADLHPGRRWPT